MKRVIVIPLLLAALAPPLAPAGSSRARVWLAAVAVAWPATAGTTSTGLRGLVTRGPITPVCRVDTPCSAPAKHTTVVFTRNGVSRSAMTGVNGRYSVLLAAGTYAVRIPTGAKFGFAPRSVYVPAGRISTRNFSIDTGIR